VFRKGTHFLPRQSSALIALGGMLVLSLPADAVGLRALLRADSHVVIVVHVPKPVMDDALAHQREREGVSLNTCKESKCGGSGGGAGGVGAWPTAERAPRVWFFHQRKTPPSAFRSPCRESRDLGSTRGMRGAASTSALLFSHHQRRFHSRGGDRSSPSAGSKEHWTWTRSPPPPSRLCGPAKGFVRLASPISFLMRRPAEDGVGRHRRGGGTIAFFMSHPRKCRIGEAGFSPDQSPLLPSTKAARLSSVPCLFRNGGVDSGTCYLHAVVMMTGRGGDEVATKPGVV